MVSHRSGIGPVTPFATRFSSFVRLQDSNRNRGHSREKGHRLLLGSKMAANAWSITASVLGSYMSGRRF